MVKIPLGIKEKEISYDNGVDTLWKYFNENGIIKKEGKMEDGQEEGIWLFYDDNGIKERETEHKSGKEE